MCSSYCVVCDVLNLCELGVAGLHLDSCPLVRFVVFGLSCFRDWGCVCLHYVWACDR